MEDIYKDISRRTGGDIYIGVVGPVRTGKSTLIKRFMDTVVIPNITDPAARERAVDELPQSADGRTVMTTEPKFIPENAVRVTLDGGAEFKIKMIDCVGYVVPGAAGMTEDSRPRMVMTPWSDEPMPFDKAAETGTRKVINEHSTIGLLVTTDGTVCGIPRSDYVEAEERVAGELKSIDKPFVIILNSADPKSEEAVALGFELEEKYSAPVALVNCLELSESDINNIISMVLYEFPIKEVSVDMPSWITALEPDNRIRKTVEDDVFAAAHSIKRAGDAAAAFGGVRNEYAESCSVSSIDLGCGKAAVEVKISGGLFFKVLSEECGIEINGEDGLMKTVCEMAAAKKKYDKISEALEQAQENGYGIVTPDVDDLRLEEPEVVRRQGGYGVRLRASASSLHIIKADIRTEVNPIMGSEKQSEEMIKYLLSEFEEDPKKIWDSNMFGKSLYELVNDGLNAKLAHMPDDSRVKIVDALGRIINEGSNGLICIIL